MSSDKRAAEEEYFARIERENRAKAQAENAVKAQAEERAAIKALHAGRCGKCGGVMRPRDFQGVEIDVCGDCNSVLLDPGELETLAGKDSSGALGSIAAMFRFKGK
mgnify:CR=1 FL=1